MAIIWNSNECRRIADDLLSSAGKLENLLDSELATAIGRGKDAYDSEAAKSLFDKLDSLKSKSSGFIDSIKKCSSTLTDEVAPAYEAIERKTASDN